MMMMPSIWGENLFDEFMDFPTEREFFGGRNPLYGKREKNLMKTDVKETENGYELAIDLPGFKKEDLSVKLEKGYLTVSAARSLDKNDDDKNGGYLRRERWCGSCSRSFYVGEGVGKDEIKARMEDGILYMTLPKQVQKLPENNQILIEG